MRLRKTVLSLLLIAVMLAGAVIPALAADDDPYAGINPATATVVNSAFTTSTSHNEGGVKYLRSAIRGNIDYNGGIGMSSPEKYTFSFSVRSEDGQKIAPLSFRERGYKEGFSSGSNGRNDYGIVTVAADGKIYAYNLTNAKDPIVIGAISHDIWTNISVCIDRATKTSTYFINGVKVYERTYDAWVLSNSATWIQINQNPGKQPGTETDPLVILHGNYSIYAGAVTENDYGYFTKAFPNMTYTNFTGVQGSLDSDLSLTYFFRLSDAQAETATVRVTRNGKVETLKPSLSSTENAITVGGVTLNEYAVTYTGIGPQNIADTVTAELLVGETLLAQKVYSAAQYLKDTVAGDPENEKLAALVDAILDYANEAILYTGATTFGMAKYVNKFDFDTTTPATQTNGINGVNGRESAGRVFDYSSMSYVYYIKTLYTYNRFRFKNLLVNPEVGDSYTVSLRVKATHIVNEDGKGTIRFGVSDNSSSGVSENKEAITIANLPLEANGEWVTYTYTFTYTQEMKDKNMVAVFLNANALGSKVSIHDNCYYKDGKLSNSPVLLYSDTDAEGNTTTYTIKDANYNVLTGYTYDAEKNTISDGTNTYSKAESGPFLANLEGSDWSEFYVDDIILTKNNSYAAIEESANALTFENKGDVKITGANVVFDTRNKIRFTVSAASLEGVTLTLNGQAVEDVEKVEDGKYYVYTKALAPTEYDTVFTLVAGESQASYNLNSYAYRMQGNDAIGRLANAAYRYGVAAKAYKTID